MEGKSGNSICAAVSCSRFAPLNVAPERCVTCLRAGEHKEPMSMRGSQIESSTQRSGRKGTIMKSSHWKQQVAIVVLCGITGGILAPRILAVRRVRDAHAESAAPTVIFTSPSQPPKGAVVLFSGKEDELKSNFYKRYSKDDSTWTVDAAGVATPAKSDLTSKK